MNVTELKRLADGAVAYGKKWSENDLEQYSRAKEYINCISQPKLSSAEYDFIIKRIADRLGI